MSYYLHPPLISPLAVTLMIVEDELSSTAGHTRVTRRRSTVATEAEFKKPEERMRRTKFSKFKAVVKALMMFKFAAHTSNRSAIIPSTRIKTSKSVVGHDARSHKCGPHCKALMRSAPATVVRS